MLKKSGVLSRTNGVAVALIGWTVGAETSRIVITFYFSSTDFSSFIARLISIRPIRALSRASSGFLRLSSSCLARIHEVRKNIPRTQKIQMSEKVTIPAVDEKNSLIWVICSRLNDGWFGIEMLGDSGSGLIVQAWKIEDTDRTRSAKEGQLGAFAGRKTKKTTEMLKGNWILPKL